MRERITTFEEKDEDANQGSVSCHRPALVDSHRAGGFIVETAKPKRRSHDESVAGPRDGDSTLDGGDLKTSRNVVEAEASVLEVTPINASRIGEENGDDHVVENLDPASEQRQQQDSTAS